MDSQFWNGKTVFLTGHTGFKGSWLSIWLQKLRCNLIGYSKSIPTKPSLFESAKVEEGMTSIMGDVCDYSKLENTVNEFKPEIVIHMAAQSILPKSYKVPLETYETNVMGTVNLLESVHKLGGVRAILNITSDKCYQATKSSASYKENDPMGGYDPYSSSKGCAELVTASFRNSFFNPGEYNDHGVALASARAGNVIGGGDWAPFRLIPDFFRNVIEGKEMNIRHPDSVRPWQYILDPLNGYLLLIEKLWNQGLEFSEGWNFGPLEAEVKPVKWIIETLSKLWNVEIKMQSNTNNFHEENFLSLDSTKARKKLGWSSKIKLDTALQWTSDWYKQYEQKKDLRKFTEQQIDNYIYLP